MAALAIEMASAKGQRVDDDDGELLGGDMARSHAHGEAESVGLTTGVVKATNSCRLWSMIVMVAFYFVVELVGGIIFGSLAVGLRRGGRWADAGGAAAG